MRSEGPQCIQEGSGSGWWGGYILYVVPHAVDIMLFDKLSCCVRLDLELENLSWWLPFQLRLAFSLEVPTPSQNSP